MTTSPKGPLIICYDGSEDARYAIERAGDLLRNRPALVLTAWQPAENSLHMESTDDSITRLTRLRALRRQQIRRPARVEEGQEGLAISDIWLWTPGTRLPPSLVQIVRKHQRRLALIARHQMPITIKRDRNARVPHIRAERLGIYPGGDHEGRVGMPALVEADRL
jgi:hypothetical protein